MATVSLKAPYFISSGRRRTPIRDRDAWVRYALMGRGLLTRDEVAAILWPNPDTMPEWWLGQVREHMHRLRRALKAHGWRLPVLWGQGWRLERD